MKTYICKNCRKEIKLSDEEEKSNKPTKCPDCGKTDFTVWTNPPKHKTEWDNLPKHEAGWENKKKH